MTAVIMMLVVRNPPPASVMTLVIMMLVVRNPPPASVMTAVIMMVAVRNPHARQQNSQKKFTTGSRSVPLNVAVRCVRFFYMGNILKLR